MPVNQPTSLRSIQYTLCKRLVSSLFSRKKTWLFCWWPFWHDENRDPFKGCWWPPTRGFQRSHDVNHLGSKGYLLSPGAVVTIITVIWDVIQSSSRNFLLPLLKPQAMAPLWPSNIPCVLCCLQPRVWIRSNKPEDKTTQLDPTKKV